MAGYEGTLAAYLRKQDGPRKARYPSPAAIGFRRGGHDYMNPQGIGGYQALLAKEVRAGRMSLDEYLHRLQPTPAPGQGTPQRLYKNKGDWIKRQYPFRPPPSVYDSQPMAGSGFGRSAERLYWQTVQSGGRRHQDNYSPQYRYPDVNLK